ncbi:MAG: MarR family transcriptional regulator [Rhodospirillales bacterium]|nr:MarR family transcriptional regulator [Rhodospirillales bacterium]
MPPRTIAAETGEGDELDLGTLTDSIGFALRGAHQASGAAFSALTGKPGHFAALTLIANNPGITQMRLADALGRSRSTMVPLLDALERDGLAIREASPRDARSHALAITAAGRDWLAQMTPRVRGHDAALTRGLTAANRAALMRILRIMKRNIAAT